MKRTKTKKTGAEKANELLVSFGDRLRHARLRVRLTQMQVAERTGLSLSWYCSLEQKGGNPTIKTVRGLLRVLAIDCTPRQVSDWLFYGKEIR